MPIRFRCPHCCKPLSVGRRKAGAAAACPSCAHELMIPEPAIAGVAASEDNETQSPFFGLHDFSFQTQHLLRNDRTKSASRWKGALLLAGLLAAFAGLVGSAALFLTATPSAQPKVANANPPILARKIDHQQPITNEKPRAAPTTKTSTPKEKRETPKKAPPAAKKNPVAKRVAAPLVIRQRAPKKKTGNSGRISQAILDTFGNPVTIDVGLAKKKDEFKGKKIVVWCGHCKEFAIFLAEHNPLWIQLRKKGFEIHLKTGLFRKEWLASADQLWLFSSPNKDPYSFVKPATYRRVAKMIPAEGLPPGWTHADLVTIFRKSLAFRGGIYHLTLADYAAIHKFVRAGSGLFLLAENHPATVEASRLAERIFGTPIFGNYGGTRIAFVRERKLSRKQIIKYNGQYPVTDHPLLTGVNFMNEGITVSRFRRVKNLEVVLPASDGHPLIAVSKIPGQRVVIDCGYTRYYHGPTPASRYVTQTAGTIRFAENVAAYLAGKGRQVRTPSGARK